MCFEELFKKPYHCVSLEAISVSVNRFITMLMKTLALLPLLCICLLFGGCKRNSVKETRWFYMAVTPWPADFTQAAVDDAYNFINANCDMVSHHFDEGIPYQEAFNNLPWPQQLVNEVNSRKTQTASGKTIFLSVSALNLTRREKAGYYANSSNIADSIKNYWKQLPVNDDKVVTAYVRYVSYLVDVLKPSFVNYGVESNEMNWNPAQFALYKDFLSKVFQQLKAKYPQLPCMISFMVSEHPAALSFASQLVPYTDYISLSAYPYTSASTTADGNTDPKKFPSDYFTRFIDLAPSRPWGFAETGFIAQDLVIPSFSLNKQGTSQWQKDYLQLVLDLSQSRKGKFLIWFCHADYDAGNSRLKSLGLYQDLFGLWQDIGFKDENNSERPSYQLWLQWQKKEKN